MANKAKSKPLAGSGIQSYMNIDVTNLTRKELADITSKLASAANKRIKRAAKLEEINPFTGQTRPELKFSEERFSVAGKDAAALRTEYKRVTSFLKTSERTTRTAEERAERKVPKWQQTIEAIGPDDISKFTKKELQAIVASLEKTVNSRVKNLQKQDVESPALRAFLEAGPLIGTKGLDLNELRNRYRRAADFLQMKTSTVAGYKQFAKEFKERTGFDYGDKKASDFWDAFERAKGAHPGAFRRQNVYEVFASVLRERLKEGPEDSYEEVYADLAENLDTLVAKATRGENIADYASLDKFRTLQRSRRRGRRNS